MKIAKESRALVLAAIASAAASVVPLAVAAVMESPSPPPLVSSIGDVETGRHLFLQNCAHCHGDDARGDEGPDLHNLHKSDARIHQVVAFGIKGEMTAFGKKLNDADIRSLTAFLRALKD
jgi:mono/diheme cytochrome c family protein